MNLTYFNQTLPNIAQFNLNFEHVLTPDNICMIRCYLIRHFPLDVDLVLDVEDVVDRLGRRREDVPPRRSTIAGRKARLLAELHLRLVPQVLLHLVTILKNKTKIKIILLVLSCCNVFCLYFRYQIDLLFVLS